MKDTLSKSMAWLHTWSGLVVGWLLFVIFVGGTADEEALSLMARSYDQLGLTELRDGSLRVLRQSFPSSRFLTQTASADTTPNADTSGNTEAAPKPWWQLW